MAQFLDILCLALFGGWAYVVAKRKNRDEIGWLMLAAATFYVTGVAADSLVFPALVKRGIFPALVGDLEHNEQLKALYQTWKTRSGFLGGVSCAFLLDIVLTFFLKPLARGDASQPPGEERGPGPPPPPGEPAETAPDDSAPKLTEAQPRPAAPPGSQPQPPDPLAFGLKYWPTGVIILIYLATQLDPVIDWLEPKAQVLTTAKGLVGARDTGAAKGAPGKGKTRDLDRTVDPIRAQQTALNDLVGIATAYQDGDTIGIKGTEADGSPVEATFAYGQANDGTTLGQLRDAISGAFASASAGITSSGRLELTAKEPGPASLSLTLADGPANHGCMAWPDHPFAQTTGGKHGYRPPYPPVREIALVVLVPAQVWLVSGSVLASAVAAVFCATFIPTLNAMEWRWSRGSSYYSHGYLIPFVVVALVHRERRRLRQLRPQADLCYPALAVLGFGLLLQLVSCFLRIFTLQGIAFVIVLCGIVLFLCGRAISKLLVFPLLYTLAMVPMPMHVIERSSFKLKMFATASSCRIVNALSKIGLHGYTVRQEGSDVTWPANPRVLNEQWARLEDMDKRGVPDNSPQRKAVEKFVADEKDKITVGDVCSGLRSLIALIAFGALFAYIAKLSVVRKLVLFLAAVPFALLANMWRIVTLTFIACLWGSDATHGAVHDVTGYGIFAIAFVLFFGLERLLHRLGPTTQPRGPASAKAPA